MFIRQKLIAVKLTLKAVCQRFIGTDRKDFKLNAVVKRLILELASTFIIFVFVLLSIILPKMQSSLYYNIFNFYNIFKILS